MVLTSAMPEQGQAPLYHLSNAVVVAFSGPTPDALSVQSRATGVSIDMTLKNVPLFTVFTQPHRLDDAVQKLSKRWPEQMIRGALADLVRAGIIVEWRSEMAKADVLKAMATVPRWYHAFELLPGLMTPGEVPAGPQRLDEVGVPKDLSGKRVLDIGAWDGPYSFELERRGASVVAYDIQDPTRTAFDTCKRILGSSVEYVRGSVYELSADKVGSFDIVLYFGVYYHLKHPLLGFQKIHRVLNDEGRLFLEGAVLDASSHVDKRIAPHASAIADTRELPLAYFTAGDDFHGHWSNWFVPNLACVGEWLRATGFVDPHLELLGGNRGGGWARKDPRFADEEHEVI